MEIKLQINVINVLKTAYIVLKWRKNNVLNVILLSLLNIKLIILVFLANKDNMVIIYSSHVNLVPNIVKLALDHMIFNV